MLVSGLAALALFGVKLPGCSNNARLFSDSFRNFTAGDVVPQTPGPASNFVLVRLVNATRNGIEFVVTAETQFLTTDEDGIQVTRAESETVRLRTFPVATASEVGGLFDCPVTRIGLGEDLNNPFSDPGLFVIPADAGVIGGGVQGFGVPSNINPLSSPAGNFDCGDTVVFRVIENQGAVGNLSVQAFVVDWEGQNDAFLGPHTFNNARNFLEAQVPEDGG
jgi:hypothetical protein